MTNASDSTLTPGSPTEGLDPITDDLPPKTDAFNDAIIVNLVKSRRNCGKEIGRAHV